MKRALAVLVMFIPLAVLGFTSGTPANASTYTQVCDAAFGACLNAAGGGPFVKAYQTNLGAYDDFEVSFVYGYCAAGSDLTTANCGYPGVPAGHVVFQLRYAGGGTWNGHCAGDEYNDPDNALMSLDSCGGAGASGAGWGTVFWGNAGPGCPSGSSTYQSFHGTGEQLGPVGGPGSEWIENASPASCMKQSTQSIVTTR